MEKIVWSSYEDSILQILRQQRKIQKWTDIANTLATEFQIKGRNGKICRQRYQQKFQSNSESSNWSFQQEKLLFKLHNELGNKWAIISRKMDGRSDNCIKNHFYSRLRKGLKKMNKIAQQSFGKRFKQVKFNILFKIIEATEDGYKNNYFCEADTSKLCFEIKNKLLALSYQDDQQHDFEPQNINSVQLYEEIHNFNKNYKRKPKKFRRIPTKAYDLNDLKQRQSSNQFDQQKSTNQAIEQQEASKELDLDIDLNKKQSKYEHQVSIENEPLFSRFEQENYKISDLKSNKKRRQSAQTGIQEVLQGSGILQQQLNLPLLELGRKGTSYLSLLSEQLDKDNIFFNQCELNSQSFQLKDLMSIKRLSRSQSHFFD